MDVMQRIILFVLTNIAVILLLSLITRLLGLHNNGIVIMAAIIGMGGAFISLAISKWMAKRVTGAKVIETPRNGEERWLVETVRRQAQQANIGMPEVAVYAGNEMNAFATGMNRNDALVAVSRGLLQHMSRDEIEAVLAHEVSHIANGDMVTLSLLQGVVNTFVILLARLAGIALDNLMRSGNSSSGAGIGYYIGSFVAEIVFGLLAMPIVMWFSRYREFHADAGAAKLVGANKMISALRRLQTTAHSGNLPEEFSAFGINGSKNHDFIQQLFSSHPPLEERIAALSKAATK
jgi:heat shock protein HtpX